MNESGHVAESVALSQTEKDAARQFLTHLIATFHARINILLVAESLLLAAMSQVWGSRELGIIMTPHSLQIRNALSWREVSIIAKTCPRRNGPAVSGEYGRVVAHPMKALSHQSRQEAHGHLSHSCGHTRGHDLRGSRLFTVSASILRAIRSLMVPIMLAGIVTSVWNRKPRLMVMRLIFPET